MGEENKSEPSVKYYRDLVVWQKSIRLARDIYQMTESFPEKERFGLTNQIRRASVSVPSNIAEGQARNQPGDFKRFLQIALGSLAEVDTQLVLAHELGYITAEQVEAIGEPIIEIRKMLFGLLNHVKLKRATDIRLLKSDR